MTAEPVLLEASELFLELSCELASNGRAVRALDRHHPASGFEAAPTPPGPKLPPGPWRSLGGYLDYTDWEDRERFLELDAAIARLAKTEIEGPECVSSHTESIGPLTDPLLDHPGSLHVAA